MLKYFKILCGFGFLLTFGFIIYSQNYLQTIGKNPRILCLVTTNPNDHKTKALAVKETWGKRCDALLFVSSQQEPGLSIIDVKCSAEDHNHLWCKNRKGLIEAHKRFEGKYDWLLKADDDTYIIVENLRHLLSNYKPTDPLWFGCPFNVPVQHTIKYYSGGAGYVMSSETIRRLIKSLNENKDNKLCNQSSEEGADDLFIGSCLENTGVIFGDERDELGRPRFFPFGPSAWLNPRGNVYSLEWFKKYSVNYYEMGENCCSDTTISFHYITPEDMYVYEFFIYRLNVLKI